VLGVLRAGRIEPVDRRLKTEFTVAPRDLASALSGELVLAEPIEGPGYGAPRARIAKRLGRADAPGAVSLIAIHENAIPHEFAHAALAEAEAAGPAPVAGREDIRAVPLVTIDDEDARDFDDAVWAEPDTDPANRDGFRLLVAIADVAWYVRPGAPLDRAAAERGNSVYFPDRVVPMLPEALSNGLCSLKPGEDRPCLAVELAIDAEGKKRRHRVFRAMMRSAARLTYRTVQDARDGIAGASSSVPPRVVDPLYGAYRALARARRERGTLDLDLPERRIVMSADGRVQSIAPRSRFDSHRLIEEFMILANVAAAETLEARRAPVMYRVHDEPSREKVEALRAFLEGLGYTLAKGEVLMPRHFERVLAKAAGTPNAQVVSEMILRAQAQAAYGPENIGHFGLALRRYCHFTSPIRRYADLLVHRALITALGLGPGGLPAEDNARHFVAVAEHVSMAERRAQKAERDTADRLVASFLADLTGAVFEGRIQGVTRFGLFVHLHESGADGLVPASSLGAERFRLDERRHTLTGERSRRRFALGDPIAVRLEEANALTGGILFALAEGAKRSGPRAAAGMPHRGRHRRSAPPRKS
jgi:ribonuclease R